MNSCTVSQSIVVNDTSCNLLTSAQWQTAPGTCRLRIKNYNPANFTGGCGGCTPSALPDWNGEFAQFCNLAPSELYSPAAGKSIGGVLMAAPVCVACNLGILAGFWVFQVACDAGSQVIWGGTGPVAAAGPIGTYVKVAGCLAGPATLDIEGFTP